MTLATPIGFPCGWIQLRGGEFMQRVSNLWSLYGLGHIVGQLSKNLQELQVINFNNVGMGCGLVYSQLQKISSDVPVPFVSSRKVIENFLVLLDSVKEKYGDEAKRNIPFTNVERRKLVDSITQLEVQLMYELDAMPIWFVTKRRAYSVDVLINNAELIFDQNVIPLFAPRTVKDIREAGRAIAFELPTAAGFHSVRAVEGVARNYYRAIGGTRPTDDLPLGPVTNEIRKQRDLFQNAGSIDAEDSIHIVIETLARLNNVYRKPISHPDMVLDLPAAINVFDSGKSAIELMLEDAGKKHTSGTIPNGYF